MMCLLGVQVELCVGETLFVPAGWVTASSAVTGATVLLRGCWLSPAAIPLHLDAWRIEVRQQDAHGLP